MPQLSNVTFKTTPGGLGRLPATDDHVSAILLDLTTSPVAWSDPLGKKYLSTAEAEADGIIEGDANYGMLWYFINEFFRMAGPSELYVINETHASFNVQNFFSLTEGRIHQAFWYSDVNYAGLSARISTLKVTTDALSDMHAPMQVVTNVIDEVTSVSDATDLRPLNAPSFSVLNAGDNSGSGLDLATSLGINYVPNGGAVLGAIARAAVHENIGWVSQFNFAEGKEMQKARFSDGQDFGQVPESTLLTLNDRGYIFFRKLLGISGMYVNDTHTLVLATDDLYSIENNRTLQKAKRVVRSVLLPDLNAPLSVDENGKLAPDTVKYFENQTSRPLTLMENAGELSNFSVFVDPEQDVLTTSVLVILVRLQPRGVARYIEVNIGFAVNLTQ